MRRREQRKSVQSGSDSPIIAAILDVAPVVILGRRTIPKCCERWASRPIMPRTNYRARARIAKGASPLLRAVLQSRDFRHLTVVLEPASIFGQGGPVMIHGVMIHDVARRSSAQAIAEKMGDPMPEAACDRGIAMLRESCAVGVRAAAALAL